MITTSPRALSEAAADPGVGLRKRVRGLTIARELTMIEL